MSKAIVTIIVGEKYQRLWDAVARPNWEQYANRHGYQLIVFRDFLDASPLGSNRSPAWQKLLTLGRPELKNVDRVLWLDADIIINSSAPDAVENVPVEKVGAVADQVLLSSPSLATPFAVNNGWNAGPAALSRQFYASNGFAAPSNYHLNSGVWVASPKHHRELFEHIYRTYPQRPHSYMEQAAFSAAIIGGGGVHFLMDCRFNVLWLEYRIAFFSFLSQVPAMRPLCIATALRNSFFLHFAVLADEMAAYDPRVAADFHDFQMPIDGIRRVEESWRMLAASRGGIRQ